MEHFPSTLPPIPPTPDRHHQTLHARFPILTAFAGFAAAVLLSVGLNAGPAPEESAPRPHAVCGVGHCAFAHPGAPRPVQRSGPRLAGAGTVHYTAFNLVEYEMREFTGRSTSVLITEADLQVFTVPQVWELVDQADVLYESFKELMGTEPAGDGPLRIAFVDNCGAGCGYIGAKGIELQPYFANGSAWFARGDIPDLYPYLVHEMTHNFDRWSAYVMFGPDAGHAWTSFMDAYVVVANQQGQSGTSANSLGYTPAEFLKKRVDEFFGPYAGTPGATWTNCVRDASCTNLNSTTVQGGFAARLAQLTGDAGTRQALAELKKAATTRGLSPAAMTPEQKNDLLIECFSRGAKTNLGRLALSLGWSITPGLLSQLDSLYGTRLALTSDADGDGFTPLQGDLNDANPLVHPGAEELVNGEDDDCDGSVDDVLVSEGADFPNGTASPTPVPFPCRIVAGNDSETDEDHFQFTLASPTRVRFSLKSAGAFAGWVFIYDSQGAWLTYGHSGPASKVDLDIALPAGPCHFSVGQNTVSAQGIYELKCFPAEPEWPTYVFPGKPVAAASDMWMLHSPTRPANLQGVTNLDCRFWISGVGWVGTNAVTNASSTRFSWKSGIQLSPTGTTCRAQFLGAGLPVSRTSEAMPFSGGFPLTSTTTAGEPILSWPAVTPGLAVFSAPVLNGPWTQATNKISFTNGQYRVPAPRSNAPMQFFRLQGNGS